jgi:predicted DNA-binding transcriptional regulator AlpA
MRRYEMSEINCATIGNVNPKSYWELKDVADFYGVSPRTIQRWVKSGQHPPPFKMGRKRLWIPEQVKECLARLGKEAEAEAEKERQRLANYSWKGGR